MTGTIARLQLEKGFGFIKDNAGQDYFFHRSAVVGEGMEYSSAKVIRSSSPLGKGRKVRAPKACGVRQPRLTHLPIARRYEPHHAPGL